MQNPNQSQAQAVIQKRFPNLTKSQLKALIAEYRSQDPRNHFLDDSLCLIWLDKELTEKEKAEKGGKKEEREKPKTALNSQTLFQDDKTKNGWRLTEDALFDGQAFEPEIVAFLKNDEFSVNGQVMKQRAKKLNANLGQRHAEYLLNNPSLIPKEWRDQYYLIFPGTVWLDPDGYAYVPCLYGSGDRRCLYFRWLRRDWFGDDRLVRPRG